MARVQAGGKLSVLSELYERIDDAFRAQLETEVHAHCMFELIKLPKADHLYPLLSALLKFYDVNENIFKFGSHSLCVTLEDVLYLTGLPIRGKPVICHCQVTRDLLAFTRVFGIDTKIMSIPDVEKIAIDQTKDQRQRKIAVLLIMVSSIINPTYDDHKVRTTYVQFLEKLESFDSFAWGAALLAFLYKGLENYCKGMKRSINGNMWVLLSFFLIRIPTLRTTVGVDFKLEDLRFPLLCPVLEKIRKISYNHKPNYIDNVKDILMHLDEGDILWTPYDPSILPHSIRNEVKFGTLLAPIFCNNYVVYHKPHVVAKQFMDLKGYDVSRMQWEEVDIEMKQNWGAKKQKFKELYEAAIEIWSAQKLVQDYMCSSTPPASNLDEMCLSTSPVQPQFLIDADPNPVQEDEMILSTSPFPPKFFIPNPTTVPTHTTPSTSNPIPNSVQGNDGDIDSTLESKQHKKAEAVYNKDADSNDAKAQPRKRCKTDVCEKKKLLVLDLNGLLVDVVDMRKSVVEGDVESDLKVNRKEVFKRPHCDEFLKFCFEKFEVGIWTSRLKKNMDPIVDYIFGDNKSKLKFLLDQAACTKTGINTFENPKKPLFLKELKKIWNSEFHMPLLEKAKYDESNTILFDDSPCKALLNPPYTAVCPPSYKFHNASTDKSLGPECDLYIYLGKLAEAENVPKYVENNMFGNMAITEKHEHWSHYIDINEKVYSNIRDKRADGRRSYPRARKLYLEMRGNVPRIGWKKLIVTT